MFTIGLAAAMAGGWLGLPYVLYRTQHQPIQFSHKTHTGDAVGMACEDCHSLGEDGRFSGIPTIATCEPCHTEPLGKNADEKRLAEDYVAKGREIPWLVYARQPENAWFPHANHVRLASLKCEECHGNHGTTAQLRPYQENRLSTYSRDLRGHSATGLHRAAWEGLKMDDCSDCHRRRGVQESCLTCHK